MVYDVVEVVVYVCNELDIFLGMFDDVFIFQGDVIVLGCGYIYVQILSDVDGLYGRLVLEQFDDCVVMSGFEYVFYGIDL